VLTSLLKNLDGHGFFGIGLLPRTTTTGLGRRRPERLFHKAGFWAMNPPSFQCSL